MMSAAACPVRVACWVRAGAASLRLAFCTALLTAEVVIPCAIVGLPSALIALPDCSRCLLAGRAGSATLAATLAATVPVALTMVANLPVRVGLLLAMVLTA
ncbi:hypothetical protein COO60DRAFT_1553848 [Scenedesmus sp. NREL 46B-D3]|nr:hypothetical protein COO60DRAFT_1553848 [Scenedesmus sp. NREL 46B-D3]